MPADAVLLALVSALLSGLLGVGVSAWFFYRLERHKLKLDLARRLLGHRFSISGDQFSCAMNEVIAVFADSPQVRLFQALSTPGKPNADEALVDFLKSVVKASGLTQVTPSDGYLLKTFNARN